MAKTKAELLEEAKTLKLDVTEKNTIVEITAAISSAASTEAKAPGIAKAGKRSAKALKEEKELADKEARKAEAAEYNYDAKPKQHQNPTRTKLERRGKKYQKAAELIDRDKKYSIKEALALAIKTATTSFDSSVEIHLRLGVDPRQADQNIRDSIVLPAGTGKTVRVAVFADVDDVEIAKKAGADVAGTEDFLQQLDKGNIDFDVLIATPVMMPKLGKYARVLGPKGLMPNPKSGTVTTDVKKAITESKAGKIEYRVDEKGIVHVPVGKVSFGEDKLLQNTKALFANIKGNKPSSLKSNYVKSVFVTTSMGPGIRLENAEL
ncbi:hypothetical protein BH23PAT2_BH23PAT2_01670 [soil metagenome]